MTYDSEVAADGPLGYWKCDETSGSVAADSSGNGRDLTINGSITKSAAALFTNALRSFDFPGSTSAYLSAAYAAWMATASFTWETWGSLDTISSLRALMSRDAASPRGPTWYINGGKHDLFQTGDNFGTATLSTATSYHLVVAYDNAAGTVSFYINGTLDRTISSVSFNNTNAQQLIVGASFAGSGSLNFPFDGKLSHLAYYGYALSGARIAAHYAAGIATPVTAVLDAEGITPEAAFTVDYQPPAIEATLDVVGLLAAPAFAVNYVAPVDTDTSNQLDGRTRSAYATPTVVYPAAPETTTTRVDKAVPLPTPTMVNGRPT